MDERDPLTERIIGCAIEVHRDLGAGLLESAYELALRIELAHQGVRFETQKTIPLLYRGQNVCADVDVPAINALEARLDSQLQPLCFKGRHQAHQSLSST